MEHLLDKFKHLVLIRARSYFIIGAEREDIIQEGMIGLYKAVRDFKADKLSNFRTFAEFASHGRLLRPSRPPLGKSISP